MPKKIYTEVQLRNSNTNKVVSTHSIPLNQFGYEKSAQETINRHLKFGTAHLRNNKEIAQHLPKVPKGHHLHWTGKESKLSESIYEERKPYIIEALNRFRVVKDADGNRILPSDDAENRLYQIPRESLSKIKVGDWHDFYHPKTKDKLYGKVVKYDGKEITFQHDGKGPKHKFKVRAY